MDHKDTIASSRKLIAASARLMHETNRRVVRSLHCVSASMRNDPPGIETALTPATPVRTDDDAGSLDPRCGLPSLSPPSLSPVVAHRREGLNGNARPAPGPAAIQAGRAAAIGPEPHAGDTAQHSRIGAPSSDERRQHGETMQSTRTAAAEAQSVSAETRHAPWGDAGISLPHGPAAGSAKASADLPAPQNGTKALPRPVGNSTQALPSPKRTATDGLPCPIMGDDERIDALIRRGRGLREVADRLRLELQAKADCAKDAAMRARDSEHARTIRLYSRPPLQSEEGGYR